MGWLGFLTNDESEYTDGTVYHPLLTGAGIVFPSPIGGAGAHSKGGWDWQITNGQSWLDVFTARASNTGKAWYYFTFEPVQQTDDAMTMRFFRTCSTKDGVNGTVAVEPVKGDAGGNNRATKFHFGLSVWNGVTWGSIGGPSRVFTVAEGRVYCRLGLDMANADTDADFEFATAKETEISMTVETSGTSAAIKIAGVTATPSIYVEDIIGKGGSRIWKVRGEEIMVHDDSGNTPGPTTAQVYTDRSSDYHCMTRYPVADVTTDWTAVNPCASGHHWTTVDDVEDDEDTVGDYVTVTGDGNTHDELFDIGDLNGSASDIGCVYIAVREDPDKPVEKILAQIEGGALQVYDSGDYIRSAGNWLFLTLNKTPEATPVAWASGVNDRTKFNALRVGVEETRAAPSTPRAYLIVVGVLGKNIARPTAATCPSTGTRRIFIC